jgi:hypothetical protein
MVNNSVSYYATIRLARPLSEAIPLLVLTATSYGLDRIGQNYGIIGIIKIEYNILYSPFFL